MTVLPVSGSRYHSSRRRKEESYEQKKRNESVEHLHVVIMVGTRCICGRTLGAGVVKGAVDGMEGSRVLH